MLDSEPSYYPSLLMFIFALLRHPALFPTLNIKIEISRGDTGKTQVTSVSVHLQHAKER